MVGFVGIPFSLGDSLDRFELSCLFQCYAHFFKSMDIFSSRLSSLGVVCVDVLGRQGQEKKAPFGDGEVGQLRCELKCVFLF